MEFPAGLAGQVGADDTGRMSQAFVKYAKTGRDGAGKANLTLAFMSFDMVVRAETKGLGL
jgi:hypothetical protein